MFCRSLTLGALLASAVFCQPPATPQPTTTPASTTTPREPGLYVTFYTSMGDIKARLFEKESPITVKNFVDLALGRKQWRHPETGALTSRPLYPGTIFHRVLDNFMIQGGDPLGTGFGGTENIKDEFSPGLGFDVPGRLAMANAGPNTGSSQFFITEVPTPHLNGKHTIFGQTVEGQDLVGKIARVPKSPDGKPRIPITLTRLTFERVKEDGTVEPYPPKRAPASKKAAPAKKPGVSKPAGTPAAKPKTPAAKPATPPAKKP